MTGYEMAHQQAEQLFRTVLPSLGMAVREGQIQLCHAMLDALFGRETALCDAGVGLGKTYAYLAAAVLWQNQKPLAMRRPIVLSTASVALQDAILKEYIPFLSSALLQYGFIRKPILAVLRKGKERYACDLRLHSRQQQIALRGERFARRLATLQEANTCLDLDQIAGLSRYDRRRICVPQRCTRDCLGRNHCRYQNYLRVAKDPAIRFQVCNHNYLLADASHRQNGWKPLLQDYGALIIDEAHRLPEANQQMNTRALTLQDLQALADRLQKERLTELTQRLRRSVQGAVMRMQNGTFRISMPPYGYRYDASGSLAIEPSEAAIVQEIFAAFLNGTNIAKIAEAILGGECDLYQLLLGTHRLAGARHAQAEAVAVEQLGAVCHDHVLADRVLPVIDAARLQDFLGTERDQNGGALGGQRAQGLDAAQAVGQHGVEAVLLLPA